MRRKPLPMIGLALAMALLAAAGAAPAGETAAIGWTAPDPDRLPDDDWGRTVRRGRELIARTYALIGPEVAEPSKRYAGNNMACQNCHIGSGTEPFGNPLVGAFATYPNYRARSGRVGTLEDRIQGCMVRSMNGRKLPPDSAEMTAMVAYLKFLATGRPVGQQVAGHGAGRMAELERPADPARGRAVYSRVCATCHGAEGQGLRNGRPGDAKGYAVPPLWGGDSFNDGAGMDRLTEAANFIHNNMPAGTTWRHPVVAVPDAWDVAAFVQSQPRPHMAGLERDYPDRWQKPVDTPYGPYADGFSKAQHRLGPFGPIRAAIALHRRERN